MTNVGASLLAKASFQHKKSLNRDKTNPKHFLARNNLHIFQSLELLAQISLTHSPHPFHPQK